MVTSASSAPGCGEVTLRPTSTHTPEESGTIGTVFGVVIALAATLGTFGGAGLLAAYTINDRRPYLIAWTVTLFGLSIALGGMTVGFMVGFGPTLFRGIQIGGSLLAPLWLAHGVVILVARQIQVRFGAWLVIASYTVVAVVILMADPVTGGFGDALPTPDHYDLLPRVLIGGAHLGAVGALVAATGITALRTRDGDTEALETLVPIATLAGAGVLVVLGMGGFLPDVLTVLVVGVAAGLVWYGARRAVAAGAPDPAAEWAGADMGAYEQRPPADPPVRGRGRRAGTRRRGAAPPAAEPPHSADHMHPSDLPGDPPAGLLGDPALSDPERSAALAALPGDPTLSDPERSAARPASRGGPRSRPAAAAGPYGHITVYTLREGQEDAFDRLTEDAVRAVREREPDTLIYACHTARNAPNQRVFYQLYRDRMAYQEHERQPHIQHFLAEGAPYVRTTKVIELKLGPAKVVPPPM